MPTVIRAGWALRVSISSSTGPLEHEARQVLAERVVDLAKDIAGAGTGQLPAHPDRLGSLSGKDDRPLMPVRTHVHRNPHRVIDVATFHTGHRQVNSRGVQEHS